MSIILNIIVLSFCLIWLYKSNKNIGVLVGIVFTYLGGVSVSFIVALVIENEYLDGLTHLLVAGGSAIVFWLLSIALLLTQTYKESLVEKIGKISIMSIAILVPLFIYLIISNMTFKIGARCFITYYYMPKNYI